MPADTEQTAGPIAGRAATIRPRAEKDQGDSPDPKSNEASPGAAEDEAQAKQRPT